MGRRPRRRMRVGLLPAGKWCSSRNCEWRGAGPEEGVGGGGSVHPRAGGGQRALPSRAGCVCVSRRALRSARRGSFRASPARLTSPLCSPLQPRGLAVFGAGGRCCSHFQGRFPSWEGRAEAGGVKPGFPPAGPRVGGVPILLRSPVSIRSDSCTPWPKPAKTRRAAGKASRS